jgi:hypothetical protein
MLSTTKYVALWVVGMEIFYALCLGYGSLLSQKGRELHQSLFELIPGFVWGNPVSMVWGGLYMGVFALIVGWYIAWMHNTSLITGRK